MKASELRIGNYAMYFNDIVMIDGIRRDPPGWYLHAKKGITTYFNVIDAFQPIPLTEEWLIKFGFTVQDKIIAWGKSTDIRHISISPSIYLCYKDRTEYNREGWYLCFFAEDEAMPEDMELAPIEYVHDFQNAVFALIREELTIKE